MKTFILLLFLVILIPIIGLAQSQTDKQRAEQLQIEFERTQIEIDERLREEAARNLKPTNESMIPFLPNNEKSWVAGIIETNGWSNTTRILAIAKSDGNYLCKNDNFAENRLISSGSFDLLSKLIAGETNVFKSADKNQPLSKTYHGTTTLLVVLRTIETTDKKNRKNTFRESSEFNMKDFTADNSRIRQVYDSVLTSAACE